MFDNMLQFNDETFIGVGELKASFDVVYFMMFQSFQFGSIASIQHDTPLSFNYSNFNIVSSSFLNLKVLELSLYKN